MEEEKELELLPLDEARWRWCGLFVHNSCGNAAYVHPKNNRLWACIPCQMMTWSLAVFFQPVQEWAEAHPTPAPTTSTKTEPKWRLGGRDRFDNEWYHIPGEYKSLEEAKTAASAKVNEQDVELPDSIWIFEPGGSYGLFAQNY